MTTVGEKPLKDKVVVVTGASRGIGKQTALSLAQRGAAVVVVARTVQERENSPGTLGDTAGELRKLGADPLVIPADLSLQREHWFERPLLHGHGPLPERRLVLRGVTDSEPFTRPPVGSPPLAGSPCPHARRIA